MRTEMRKTMPLFSAIVVRRYEGMSFQTCEMQTSPIYSLRVRGRPSLLLRYPWEITSALDHIFVGCGHCRRSSKGIIIPALFCKVFCIFCILHFAGSAVHCRLLRPMACDERTRRNGIGTGT
ncbi:hypothetical protein BC832DRAFT_125371 [Gaertneriomyces semiglobifer]|nr:hypothetical protein BC832DRAFT_125371 [Gaertneriomyces semiglobifer]